MSSGIRASGAPLARWCAHRRRHRRQGPVSPTQRRARILPGQLTGERRVIPPEPGGAQPPIGGRHQQRAGDRLRDRVAESDSPASRPIRGGCHAEGVGSLFVQLTARSVARVPSGTTDCPTLPKTRLESFAPQSVRIRPGADPDQAGEVALQMRRTQARDQGQLGQWGDLPRVAVNIRQSTANRFISRTGSGTRPRFLGPAAAAGPKATCHCPGWCRVKRYVFTLWAP